MARYDGYFDRGYWGRFGGPERSGRYGSDWRRGYDRDFGPGAYRARYDQPFRRSFGPGYDAGFRAPRSRYDRFAREPFMPEAAYRRHPEYARPPLHRSDQWPAAGRNVVDEEDLSDEQIRREVLATMEEDSWIISDQIEVTVDDGVVTLRGEVGDYMEARYAWDDAWETVGVRGVINHLTVRTQPTNS